MPAGVAKDEQGRNRGIAHLKTSVGSGLNKALAAIEDANPNTLQDVLKGINFNRKVGQRSMDDDTLVAFNRIKRGPSLSTNLQSKGIRYLTSDNIIQDGRLDWTIKKHLNVVPSSLKSILNVGDVLLNCVNSEEQIGKTGYVDALPEQATVGFNRFAFTFQKGNVVSRYAYFQMSDSRFQQMLRQMVKPAINQASFSSTDILEMPFARPSIDEQERIASRLDATTSSITSEQATLQNLYQVKTGLMQDLLTGKVRVKVDEADEVATHA